MPNTSQPRYQRWYVQQQSAPLLFNNSSGTWSNTGAQLIRVDAGSASITKNAPYSRFPVLTGTKSEVAGIRGRKLASFSIRGLPVIPSGAAGTIPDIDIFLQNVFGAAATVVSSTSATYAFNDSGYLAFSLFKFMHGFSTLTQMAMWGCFVSRITFNFNGQFLTADVEGFGGYAIDNPGFAAFDSQAKAGLTVFPVEPSSPTVLGQPIAGFGNGYTCTLDAQALVMKVRALSVTYETGFVPVADVMGSAYLADTLGDARRVSINFGDLKDDDSAALDDIKLKSDTDNVTVNATIVAGNVAGSIITFNVNNIQLNSYNQRDNGPSVATEIPQSFAHASAIGLVNDSTIAFT